MKKRNCILLSIIMCLSCSTYKKMDLSKFAGVFIGKESRDRIVLTSDNMFYYLAPKGSKYDENWGLDTMSFGSWQFDENYIELNSSKKILGRFLSMDVEESKLPNIDSIFVEIDCPYERILLKQMPFKINTLNWFNSRPFHYYVCFKSNNNLFTSDSQLKKGGNSIFYLNHDKNLLIRELSIEIIPDNLNYPGFVAYKSLYTIPYRIKDQSSNYFKITIPEFIFRYLNYRRFYGEYVRVKSKNVLLWHSELFIKEFN